VLRVFNVVIFKKIFSHMEFPVKQVWTLEERLRVIEVMEKTPAEKRADIAK
jgi:hypothetical protein